MLTLEIPCYYRIVTSNACQISYNIHSLQSISTDIFCQLRGYIFELNFGINHLQIIRLARKLPTGDVSALKTGTAEDDEDSLDENDLT